MKVLNTFSFYYFLCPILLDKNTVYYEHYIGDLKKTARLKLGADAIKLLRQIMFHPTSSDNLFSNYAKELGLSVSDLDIQGLDLFLKSIPFIGFMKLEMPPHEILIVDYGRGSGGVHMHGIQLWKRLNEFHNTVFLTFDDLPFGQADPELEQFLINPHTLRSMGAHIDLPPVSELPYGEPYAFLSLARSIIGMNAGKLLFFNHKARMPIFFDLIEKWKSLAHCDGYGEGWDNLFNFITTNKKPNKEKILMEILFYTANSGRVLFAYHSWIKAYGIAIKSLDHHWLHYPVKGYDKEVLGKPVEIVPQHVDRRIFYPRSGRREYVLFTTSVDPGRGIGGEELKNLLKRLPPEIQFLILARPSPFFSNLKECHPNVRFLESVPREQMPEVYSNAMLYFRVGKKDSVPMSMMEAMACGTPVLVSDIIAEHFPPLRDGENCFVTKLGDLEKQFETIMNVFNNPDLGRFIGENGRRLIHEKYDLDLLVQKIRSLL